MSFVPLGYLEKAALSPLWWIMSQETCRNFLGLTNLGEKSAADLSLPQDGFEGVRSFCFKCEYLRVFFVMRF